MKIMICNIAKSIYEEKNKHNQNFTNFISKNTVGNNYNLQSAYLETNNGLELSKVIKLCVLKEEGEAGAVAGVLAVHEQVMDLLHQLHTAYLQRGTNNTKEYCILN